MADKSLYSRLRRLFSTNVIVRNVGGKRLKVADTDNVQGYQSNNFRDKYSRIHAGSYGMAGPGNSYGINMAYQTQRLMLFRDYDVMDNDSIIASALDIYADESTVKNEFGDILTIHTDNQNVKEVLHNLFYDILNIEFNLWPWIRNLCKYGDFFLFLEISEKYGIINALPLSVYDTVRVEGEKPENPHYVYFETLGMNGAKAKFENYEIAHFRLLSDSNFLPYGKAAIEGARRVHRQLILMEDAMLIHRIMRAPEKRVFKIDIGNIPPNEVDTYIQKLIDRSKKVPFIDPSTGDYNLRYNMQNLLEDFYIPVRGGDSGTDISNIGGLEYSPIDDIEYLRNRMLAALKIPKAFLGYDENVNGKATLAAEDVRFARTIERIQRIVVSELTKIAIVHLYAQGFTDDELINFSLELTNPSTIAEQEKINLWTQQITLIQQMQGTKLIPDSWMYEEVMKLTPDQYEAFKEKLIEDTKFKFRLMQIEQGQSDPAKFGFPQERPPEENMDDGVAGVDGEPMPPGPSGAPQSLDDLPLENEAADDRGQPRKGATYAQDSHVRGRDPLGFKERYSAMQVGQKRTPSKKSPLSLEVAYSIKNLKSKLAGPSQMLAENTLDGTYLDETNIIDKE